MNMSKSKTVVLRVSFATGERMAVDAAPYKHGVDSRVYDYYYVTREGEEVKAGMHAIVDGAGQGMTVVYIRKVLSRSTRATNHALAVFSVAGYQERLDRQERITALREEILEQAELAKERERLKTLAASDEGLAKLLKELEELEAE